MSEKTWKEVLLPIGMTELMFLNGSPSLAAEAKFERFGDNNYNRIHVFVHTDLSVSEVEDTLKKIKEA